ncbi:MAG TPA: arylsulfatase [Fimbriimonadaceae bacterium]|nr:arylsulfatase [Fimbriimonadaceae bacterium]
MASGPNVVLICVDQWRGDALGCDGHPFAMTPHLDHLAGDGTRFAKTYSATPSCIASRAALYTGLSQTSTRRVGYRDGVPWDIDRTIASEFTANGYQTQAIGKLHVFPERSQIGFQNVILHDGYLHFARKKPRDPGFIDDYIPWLREKTGDPRADYFDNGLNCNSQVARPWDKDEALHPTTWVVTEAIDFLRRRDPSKPFFLYLGFHRPHPPYDPPAWAFEQYLNVEMPSPPYGDWASEVLEPYNDGWRADPNVAMLSRHALQRARAGYFGHITHIDLQINRFLETLAEHDLRESTVICFVSDHGEMLGDHGAFRKVLPYEGSARVPMILQGPGIPRQIVVGDAVAEMRDVMPTLLDAAGLPIPEGLDGKSLLPVAEAARQVAQSESADKSAHSIWREHLHGEHTAFGQSVQWITDGRFKYVWWSGTGREQLFDLAEDPQELHDLRESAEVEKWRAVLIKELAGREEAFVQDGKLVTGQPVSALLSHPRRG